MRIDKPFTRLAVVSSRGFISLAFTTPSLTLALVLSIFAFVCLALFWYPVFRKPTRIRKTCFVVAIYDHHGIYMEYDGLLLGQGVRAKSSKQPQRWICYETDEKSHSRYCTLLYGERGHVGWSALAAKLVESRSFGGDGKQAIQAASGRCDRSAPASRSRRDNKRKCWEYRRTCPATTAVVSDTEKMNDTRFPY
jgi:hypothetical protein